MWRFVFIAFLILHGAIHAAIWATPKQEGRDIPFDASHSWLLGGQRALAMTMALAVAGLLVASGIGLWVHAEWWRPVAVTGLAGSFILMALYFNSWFLPIQAVNLALVATLVWGTWPTRSMLGV
jgi:hypothetical protein